MKLKNVLLTGLSFVLVAAVAIGGTLAYLTSTDEDVNVMTLGNVSIAQHEYERIQNADGSYQMITSAKYGEGYKLQEFTQAKPLYPATGTITGWGGIVPFDQIEGASGTQAVFAGLNNVQDKFVLVENTGKTDAYVRTLIALEYGSNTKDIIGISTGDFWNWNNIGIIEVDGNNYYLLEAIYNGSSSRHIGGVLPAGEYTYNSLGQVYLNNEATNEDCEALDGNNNGAYDILVFSQAVQTEGFADAQTALDTAFGDITTTSHPWIDGADLPTIVTTTNELKNALKTKGATVVLTSGTYDMDGSFSIAEGVTLIGSENSVIKGTLTSTMKNITVKNVTFKGGNAQRWAYANGNVVFENCTFDANSVYAIHYDGTSGADITYKNCDIIGWVAIAGGQNSLTFDGCRIFGNGTYGVIRTYSDTTIKNCTFDVDNVNTTDVYQDGIHAVDCTITVENCTNVNGEIDALFNVSGTGKIIKK